MRGVGTASGAVTLVNALPTGVGCAVAIAIPARAEVELRPGPRSGPHRIRFEKGTETELARETVRAGLNRFAPGVSFSGEVRIESGVPVGKGLKSSSAVEGALLRAIANALHRPQDSLDLARIAARVAQKIGLSATGAFDDCVAALRGGIAFTDNLSLTPLRAAPLTPGLRAVIWVPVESHAPSPAWLERFRAESAPGRAVVEAARAGRWGEAMSLNSALVERVMGYDYGTLRAELLAAGAAMCGVSGMGPSVAALVPADRVDPVLVRFAARPGEVLNAALRPEDGTAGVVG